MSETQEKTLINKLFEEWKQGDDYADYKEGLIKDNPTFFLSSIELALYGYWHEHIYSNYCEKNDLPFISLYEMPVERPEVVKGEIKGIDIKKPETMEEIDNLPIIKGYEKLIQLDKDAPFELPTLEEEPTIKEIEEFKEDSKK